MTTDTLAQLHAILAYRRQDADKQTCYREGLTLLGMIAELNAMNVERAQAAYAEAWQQCEATITWQSCDTSN